MLLWSVVSLWWLVAVVNSSLCLDWCSQSTGVVCVLVCGDLPDLHWQLAATHAKLEATRNLQMLGTLNDDRCSALLTRQEEKSQLILFECQSALESVESRLSQLDNYVHAHSQTMRVLLGLWIWRLCRWLLPKFR